MLEEGGQPRVPPLGRARRPFRRRPLLGVVVDVEVGRGEHLEVEVAVLDVVLPEVLRLAPAGNGEQKQPETCPTMAFMIPVIWWSNSASPAGWSSLRDTRPPAPAVRLAEDSTGQGKLPSGWLSRFRGPLRTG
jgi:hypothetical protein